jgi:putative transposase
LARKVGRQFKSEQDLADFSRLLKKITVEAALGGEIEDHLGYSKHEVRGRGTGNSRNGYSRKTLKGDHGEVEIDTPRDRNGTFEPQIVRKGQTRLTQFDDQILALYAKGMSTRDIVATFKEMYGADVSASLISKVTDAVLDRVLEWQARPLDAIYPIVYLDCIVLKIRQDKRVLNKAVYLALGINLEGQKELLGLWLAETEGAKFWCQATPSLAH